MSNVPLEVIVKIATDFAAIKGERQPTVQRQNPTGVLIYQGESLEVYLHPDIQRKDKIVTVPSATGAGGSKMEVWTGQQMTVEAIAYAAAQVRLLAKGAPVNVSCPEQYKAAFEVAYAKS